VSLNLYVEFLRVSKGIGYTVRVSKLIRRKS